MSSDYISAALAIVCGAGFAFLLSVVAQTIPWRRPSKAKDYPYECGSEVIGSPRTRFEIKFYQVAILFLVFDIETAFLYPWAVLFRKLGWLAYGEMLVFLSVLVVALAYGWRKRAIGWG